MKLQALLDRFARRSPELALAHARARLERVDDRAHRALVVEVRRKEEQVAQLGRRLVLAKESGLERARALEARRRDRLAGLTARLSQAGRHDIERRRSRLQSLAELLGTLSYRSILDRGFALVRDGEGRPLKRAEEAEAATRLSLQFADGTVEAVPGKGKRTASRAKAKPLPQGSLFDA